MIPRILDGRTALVTGGTRGLGHAIGLALAKAGARTVLTHRWGTTADVDVVEPFHRRGLEAPLVVAADVSDPAATAELMARIREARGSLDVVVSNVAFARVVRDLDELKRGTFELSLRYSAWPVVDLVQGARAAFDRYPRHVVGVSSWGAEVCHPGYDLAGAAKAVLEALCRYLALRLRPYGTRVNAIRPGFLDTDSARATFGDDAMQRLADRGLVLSPERAARACVALCSGLLDGMTGQVLSVDEGWSLVSEVALAAGGELPRPFPPDEEPE